MKCASCGHPKMVHAMKCSACSCPKFKEGDMPSTDLFSRKNNNEYGGDNDGDDDDQE